MSEDNVDTVTINKPAEVNISTTNSVVDLVTTTSTAKMAQVTSNLSDDDLREAAIERIRWENRRRIAWVFTYATIAYGFSILAVLVAGTKEMADRITASTDLLTWIFMGMLSVVGFYFGGTVLEKFTGSKKTKVYAIALGTGFLVIICLVIGYPSKGKLTLIKPLVIVFMANSFNHIITRWS